MILGTIYCFTNKVNNKKYIGSTTVDPNHRKAQHFYTARHDDGNKYNYPLYQAMRKYGENNFEFTILYQKECDEDEIRKIEKDFILEYNTLSPNGYNQTLDTEHPRNNAVTYKKMSETKRENSSRVAEVTKDKEVVEIYRSVSDCAEILGLNEKHIAACCRGERKTTGGKYFCLVGEDGEPLFPEYIGATYKGASGTTQVQSTSRVIRKYDLKGNFIEEYATAALAARENNCDASGIIKVCKGKRNQCGGFIWAYGDD